MMFVLGLLRKIPILVWPLLAVLAFAGVQTWRLHSSQTTIAEQRAQAQAYLDAQATNLSAIATLKADNAAYASSCDLKLANAQHAVATTIAYAQAQQKRAANAEIQLEKLYVHNAAAKAWSVGVVPRGVRDSLRANDASGAH